MKELNKFFGLSSELAACVKSNKENGENKMKLGATETRDNSNRVYVNLRTGFFTETSPTKVQNVDDVRSGKEAIPPGYRLFTTKNKSGTEYHFFARTYWDIAGYINEIKFHEHTLDDGTRLSGWNITVGTGEKEFIIQVGSKDRPYAMLMSVLPNVDFSEPVKFVAFMGKGANDKPQKVLLVTQNPDETAKDWVKPKYEAKWLSQMLYQKAQDLNAGEQVVLTEEEDRNLVFDEYKKVDLSYPYIREKRSGGWNFDNWEEFLFGKMETEVLPKVTEAVENREPNAFQEFIEEEEDELEYSGAPVERVGSPHEPPDDPFDEYEERKAEIEPPF